MISLLNSRASEGQVLQTHGARPFCSSSECVEKTGHGLAPREGFRLY